MPIVPDTKNWTWVVDRRCDECGYEASTVIAADPVTGVGSRLRENAAAWPAVLRRADVRERPNDATWSPLEYAAHVRDVCRLYKQRLALMLEQDDPVYPNWDQDATAIEDRYAEQDPLAVASQISDAASALADDFDALSVEQWQRRGSRDDGATFTVDTFSRYFLHDVVHHLWDVRG